MPRGVSSARLAELFRFAPRTVAGWYEKGFLGGHVRNRELCHSSEDVVALLEKIKHGAHKELTYGRLVSGRVKVLTTREAAALLGIQPTNLTRKVRTGDIAALRFIDQWRFIDTTLVAYLNTPSRPLGRLSRAEVMHVLGGSRRILRELVRRRLLRPILQKKGEFQYFTESSVNALVCKLLPPWAQPDAGLWVTELQSSSQPAMTTAEVIEQLGIKDSNRRGLDDLIRNRQIFYLTLPGGNRRFSPVSVHDLFMQQKPLTQKELMWIFGGEPAAVQEWTGRHMWGCSLHDHTTGLEYRHACVVNILTARLSPGVQVGKWLESRKRPTSTPLITVETMAQKYGVTVQDLTFAARHGFFGGVQQPGGEWAFPQVRLKVISRARLLHWLATHKKTPNA